MAIDLASRPDADIEYLRALVGQQAGQPYSNAKIQQSIAALMATRELSSAKVEVTPENAGLRLTFVLEPAYYLGLVQFPGAVPTFSLHAPTAGGDVYGGHSIPQEADG